MKKRREKKETRIGGSGRVVIYLYKVDMTIVGRNGHAYGTMTWAHADCEDGWLDLGRGASSRVGDHTGLWQLLDTEYIGTVHTWNAPSSFEVCGSRGVLASRARIPSSSLRQADRGGRSCKWMLTRTRALSGALQGLDNVDRILRVYNCCF